MTASWRTSLETCDPLTGQTQVILRSERLIEAPNWHPDGWFLVNGDGRLWRADAAGLSPIATPEGLRCNNDHGFLPDGSIVFTAHDAEGPAIWRLRKGHQEQAERLTGRPSWWHGAHGTTITYAAARGDRQLRIAEMDLLTGQERLLTHDPGHHDGPDYSACGRYLWFNSDATGHAQIWRMARDGQDAVPVFRDDRVNWFPHPSPCGRWVVYLSYPPSTEGHPRDLPVELWIMAPDGIARRRLFAMFGGQGTLNVPCWAPDGRAFAFARYAPA
ncbi:TolB family protein [Gemmobacter denitrificans]|uniref:WD40 repeat protein n=1 Tax=Gemmobacter denitrificans TaxID=3123040 RepID=A0ABU8BTW9_9RHOB